MRSIMLGFALLLALCCHGVLGADKYRLRLVANRCLGDAEYIGFFNRSCTTGLENPSAGPSLRTASDGNTWREWMVTYKNTVFGGEFDGMEAVTFKATRSGGNLRCAGYLKPYYNRVDPCNEGRLRLITTSTSYKWILKPAGGVDTNQYYLVTSTRGSTCKRYITAPSTCSIKTTNVTKTVAGDRSKWKFELVGETPPTVNVDSIGETTATVKITKPTAGSYPRQYRLLLKRPGESATISAWFDANVDGFTTSRTLTGLTKCTDYEVQAQGLRRQPTTTTPVSTVKSFKTSCLQAPPVADISKITKELGGCQNIYYNFEPPQFQVTQYCASVSTTSTPGAYTCVSSTQSFVQICNLNPATNYHYFLYAVNAAGKGPVDEHYPPDIPDITDITDLYNNNCVTVTWRLQASFGENTIQQYCIGYTANPALEPTNYQCVGSTTNNYQFCNLLADTAYTYWLVAKSSSLTSSPDVHFQPPANPITQVNWYNNNCARIKYALMDAKYAVLRYCAAVSTTTTPPNDASFECENTPATYVDICNLNNGFNYYYWLVAEAAQIDGLLYRTPDPPFGPLKVNVTTFAKVGDLLGINATVTYNTLMGPLVFSGQVTRATGGAAPCTGAATFNYNTWTAVDVAPAPVYFTLNDTCILTPTHTYSVSLTATAGGVFPVTDSDTAALVV